MPPAIKKFRNKYFVHDAHTKWSVWVAGFWGVVGALIVIFSALLYQGFNLWVGGLLILSSASFAIARYLKQPGTS